MEKNSLESKSEKALYEDLETIAQLEKEKNALLLAMGKSPGAAARILNSMDINLKSEEVFEILDKKEKSKNKITKGAETVQIGKIATPIFRGEDENLKWDLAGEQFREQGQTMAEIKFKRNDGVEIVPGQEAEGETRFDDRERFLPFQEYKFLKKEYAVYLKRVKDLASDNKDAKGAAAEYLRRLKTEHPESEWVLRSLRHLNGMVSDAAKETLELDPEFIETPHVVQTMEKVTKLVNRQLERGQGITILEGDAGTGKNKIADHFAALTRRPLFRFTCSSGKDEQDLKYLLEYNPKKGTYRIKSTVYEALETPGAILEFDEINTLKPEVAKMLNSLFDHDRALFLGEDRKAVKAAEGVVLMGLQNPQHYMGVKPLAETIKSRARIMEVDYPPFEKKTAEQIAQDEADRALEEARANIEQAGMLPPPVAEKKINQLFYRSDEALIVRQYVPELKNLSQEEFQLLWDALINKKISSKAKDLITPTRQAAIENIKEIVATANAIRQAYRAYHEGKLDQPIKFVFSLRESVESAFELSEVEVEEDEKKKGITPAKKAIMEVVLPKVPMGEERIYLETLIKQLQ